MATEFKTGSNIWGGNLKRWRRWCIFGVLIIDAKSASALTKER